MGPFAPPNFLWCFVVATRCDLENCVGKKQRSVFEIWVPQSKDADSYTFLSHELKGDREIATQAVSAKGYLLQEVPAKLLADRENVMAAVSQCGLALAYATNEVKEDDAIVMAAVSQHGLALQYATAARQHRFSVHVATHHAVVRVLHLTWLYARRLFFRSETKY